MTTIASGHGIATMAAGKTLDVWFPAPQLGALAATVPSELTALVGSDEARGVTRELVKVEIDITAAPTNALNSFGTVAAKEPSCGDGNQTSRVFPAAIVVMPWPDAMVVMS